MILTGAYNVNDLHLIGAIFTQDLGNGQLFVLPDGLDLTPLSNPTTMAALRAAQLDAKAAELQNAKLALAACLEILFDFVKNPALYSTANQLKLAAVERYKTKLQ